MRNLLLLVGILATCPVLGAAAPPQFKDARIWWRTQGAAVVELHHHRCSLLRYDDRYAFIFSWSRSTATFYVEDNLGQLPSAPAIQAAVRIGGTWLGHGAQHGKLNLTATGDRLLRSITVTQPVMPLLAKARSITFHLAGAEAHMLLDHGRMPALLRALRRCRSVIR